jgi:hypothetical protein
MTRNVECAGHPHSTRLGCGWRGERFPSVQMTRAVPFVLLPGSRLVFTDEYIDAIAKKPCPQCGGIVMPITTEDVGWPSDRDQTESG